MFDTSASASGNIPPDDDAAVALQILAKLATAPVRGATSEHLKARIETFTKLRAALDAAQLHMLAELDAQNMTDAETGLQTVSWTAKTAQVTRARAKQQVNVARKLRTTYTEFDAALTAGEITFDHAAIYTTIASCPRIEETLIAAQRSFIELIPYCTQIEHWAAQIRAFVRHHDQDGSYNPIQDAPIERLTWHKSFNGDYLDINARLTGTNMILFEQHLTRETQYQFEKHYADHKQCPELTVPAHPTLAALALCDLLRRGITITPDADNAPCTRTEITLLIDASKPEHAFIRNGLQPGTELNTTQTLESRCDAIFNTLILESLGPNGQGVPLNHGHDLRLANRKQRRAAEARDGGCVYPGCHAPPSWSILHHVQHWENNGPTDLNNLALLCAHHHGVVHRNGWSMRVIPPDKPDHPHDIWFEFISPQGIVFRSQRHGMLQRH